MAADETMSVAWLPANLTRALESCHCWAHSEKQQELKAILTMVDFNQKRCKHVPLSKSLGFKIEFRFEFRPCLRQSMNCFASCCILISPSERGKCLWLSLSLMSLMCCEKQSRSLVMLITIPTLQIEREICMRKMERWQMENSRGRIKVVSTIVVDPAGRCVKIVARCLAAWS